MNAICSTNMIRLVPTNSELWLSLETNLSAIEVFELREQLSLKPQVKQQRFMHPVQRRNSSNSHASSPSIPQLPAKNDIAASHHPRRQTKLSRKPEAVDIPRGKGARRSSRELCEARGGRDRIIFPCFRSGSTSKESRGGARPIFSRATAPIYVYRSGRLLIYKTHSERRVSRMCV